MWCVLDSDPFVPDVVLVAHNKLYAVLKSSARFTAAQNTGGSIQKLGLFGPFSEFQILLQLFVSLR